MHELRLSTIGFCHVVPLVDAGGGVYYVRFWSHSGALMQPDMEALLASSKAHA